MAETQAEREGETGREYIASPCRSGRGRGRGSGGVFLARLPLGFRHPCREGDERVVDWHEFEPVSRIWWRAPV